MIRQYDVVIIGGGIAGLRRFNAILRAQRYIFDSRTTNMQERLQILQKPHGIWACKSYFMCTLVCPKNIKVTAAIVRTKKKILQGKQAKHE